MKLKIFALPIILIAALLQGCASAVVGGAATGAAVIHDRRTVGTFVDDEIIEVKATQRLFSDQEIFDNTHINVTAYNNIILLSGEAPTDTLKNKASLALHRVRPLRDKKSKF